MNLHVVIACSILTSAACAASGQVIPRRATLVGGGSENRGKCTVEVVVDGAAEVSINGTSATLRNLRGQTPQWRRFECSGIMPARPQDFRFQGVDGRGAQSLVRDPRNGGPAVIQIQDTGGGSEAYTFDIFWGNQPGGDRGGYPPMPGRGPEPGYDGPPGRGDEGRYRGPVVSRDPVLNCQEAVRREAAERYHLRDLDFRKVEFSNRRGPRDVVEGFAESRRGRASFRFSCSVDLRDGDVRSVDLREVR